MNAIVLLAAVALAGQFPTTDVRLATCRVVDTDGIGSAVPIGRVGSSQILLCADHVVGNSTVIVERFSRASYPYPSARYRARLIANSPETDLALLAVGTSDSFATIRVKPTIPRPPFEVLWSGCAGGDAPTTQTAIVLRARNEGAYEGKRWLTDRCPRRGQSGGPLVDATGQLVGIVSYCQGHSTGGFCHLSDIHDLLDEANLSQLYHRNAPARPAPSTPKSPPSSPPSAPSTPPRTSPDIICFPFHRSPGGSTTTIIINGRVVYSDGGPQRPQTPLPFGGRSGGIIIDQQRGTIRVGGIVIELE